jgi:signal transduction histidine kinase
MLILPTSAERAIFKLLHPARATKTEQIFTAFFSTKSHGTGTGLPISRSIIESHGGRLWATSNSGQGASFHFTLPSEVESREASARGDAPLSA